MGQKITDSLENLVTKMGQMTANRDYTPLIVTNTQLLNAYNNGWIAKRYIKKTIGDMLKMGREIDWDDMTEAAPAFLTIVFMPFTYSIADGIAFGFISYAVIKLLCNRVKDVPPMVWIVAVLWALKFWYLGG